jgi:nicotinamidase-related amidase
MRRAFTALVLLAMVSFPLSSLSLVQAGSGPEPPVELPEIPAPVAVQLDGRTTAFLILDLVEVICQPRPGCPPSLPLVGNLLARARAANVPVVYSTVTAPSPFMPQIAPRGGEPQVASSANKFFRTELEDILVGMGVDTLVIVGSAANGAVLYTSFAANARGYTVVVAEDGISANTDFQVLLTRHQLLNQPGFGNAPNTPLQANAVTLSRTDLITFR